MLYYYCHSINNLPKVSLIFSLILTVDLVRHKSNPILFTANSIRHPAATEYRPEIPVGNRRTIPEICKTLDETRIAVIGMLPREVFWEVLRWRPSP